MKRIFDLILAALFLLITAPLLLVIALFIKVDSSGPVFYKQIRVGKDHKDFKIFKFRTMVQDADKQGLLTLGDRDNRVTNVGVILRKTKLDELAQIFNVLNGTMSWVGPRPEVRKYVDLYTEEQSRVLLVKPGITDLASIKFIDEAELLLEADNPEIFYIQNILPQKIQLNMEYINNPTVLNDIRILALTFLKIIAR